MNSNEALFPETVVKIPENFQVSLPRKIGTLMKERKSWYVWMMECNLFGKTKATTALLNSFNVSQVVNVCQCGIVLLSKMRKHSSAMQLSSFSSQVLRWPSNAELVRIFFSCKHWQPIIGHRRVTLKHFMRLFVNIDKAGRLVENTVKWIVQGDANDWFLSPHANKSLEIARVKSL